MNQDKYYQNLIKRKKLQDQYKQDVETKILNKVPEISTKEKEEAKLLVENKTSKLRPPPNPKEFNDDATYIENVEAWKQSFTNEEQQIIQEERAKFLKNLEQIMTPTQATEFLNTSTVVDLPTILKINKYWKGIVKKLKDTFVAVDYQTLEKMLIKILLIVEDPTQERTQELITESIDKQSQILDAISQQQETIPYSPYKMKTESTQEPMTPRKTFLLQEGDETPQKLKNIAQEVKQPVTPTSVNKRAVPIKLYTLTELVNIWELENNREKLVSHINEKIRENLEEITPALILKYVNPNSSISIKQKYLQGYTDMVYSNAKTKNNISEKSIRMYVLPLVAGLRNWFIGHTNATYDRKSPNDREINDAVRFSQKIVGYGLKNSEKRWEALGRYLFDKQLLDDTNQLRVYHKASMNQVKYFPTKLVSDEAVGLIYFLVDKKKFNQKMFENLDKEEKAFISSLMRKSGLAKMLNIFPEDEEASEAKELYLQLKERYEILDGEIEAGNNNPEVKKELEQVKKQLKQQITFMASKLNIYGLKTAQMMILSL
jgi:hypothetical protein